MKVDKEPIYFTTDDNRLIKLVWDKREYRAYEQKGETLIDLRLGSTLSKNLIEYIKKGGGIND